MSVLAILLGEILKVLMHDCFHGNIRVNSTKEVLVELVIRQKEAVRVFSRSP